MQFSIDNILVINQLVVRAKLEPEPEPELAAGCLRMCTRVCKANDELYLWGNISR